MWINQTSYVVVNPFLSMNCIPNFILIVIPEETANFWRQDTHKMLRYKEFKFKIRFKFNLNSIQFKFHFNLNSK